MNYGKGESKTTHGEFLPFLNEIYLLLWRDVKCEGGVMWFDMAPARRRDTQLGVLFVARVSGCLGDSWQSASGRPTLTSDRQTVTDK